MDDPLDRTLGGSDASGQAATSAEEPPEGPAEPAPEAVTQETTATEGASEAPEAAAEEPEPAPEEAAEEPEPTPEAAEEPEPAPEAAAEEPEPAPEAAEEPEPAPEEAAEEPEPAPEEAAEEPEPAPEAAAEEPEPAEEGPPEVAAAEEVPREDPFAGPGDWYVIHTYAGYENKVKTNLGSRIQTMQMQDKIFDVVIPMEDVMEIKGGRKQVVQKKVFPGYLLVRMDYDDDSWYVVRNTPGVTGFVSSGTGQKPTPLSRLEVEKILTVEKEEAKPAFRLEFEEGDVVRIVSGPFADFNGTISEINVDQSKVKVMVNIFDRETPVELSFDQVARV